MQGQPESVRPRVSPDREELLERAARELLDRGLAESSLRRIAKAIGVSARMLLYYFGSKERFLQRVLETIRAREHRWMRRGLHEEAAGARPSDALLRTWRQISRPEFLRVVRLYAEINARELAEPNAFDGLGRRAAEDWRALVLPTVETHLTDASPREQEAIARLLVASIRGLQLDLCSSEDRQGVDDAVESLGRLLDGAVPSREL